MQAKVKIEESDTESSEQRSPEYVVDIVDLRKSFQRRTVQKGGYSTVKSSLLSLFRKRSQQENDSSVTHAVRDLTLRIPRGASVGVIGRNGSGKSTFLKLLTGIYRPDGGTVKVSGKISALIELGAGFHPDFSGRENLHLAGVMHGLTRKQIDERFDQIVAFAELAHVIDDPVRTYSSGMFMRLGFSIAVHTDPDILLIDEVLAVGDLAFVAKCKERIGELHRKGTTLILVTHDLDSVERWCDEAIWLHEGEVKDRGYPRRVIDHYRHFLEKGEELKILDAEPQPEEDLPIPTEDTGELEEKRRRWGSREIEIISVELCGKDSDPRRVLNPEESSKVVVEYKIHSEVDQIVFGIGINRTDGVPVFGTNTEIDRIKMPTLSKQGSITFEMPRLGLLAGGYEIDIAVHRSDGYPYDYHKAVIGFSVRSERNDIGVYRPAHHWSVNGIEVVPS